MSMVESGHEPPHPAGVGESLACRPPIRVLCVDPHPVMQAGIEAMLSWFTDLQLVASVATAAEALGHASRVCSDVVLLSTQKPDDACLALVAALRACRHDCALVLLADTAEPLQVLRALRAGATGYLLKSAEAFALAQAIRTVHRGGTAMCPEASAALVQQVQRPAVTTALSPREQQVLGLVMQGQGNTAIAAALCLSSATVKFHLTSIFQKLGVRTRTEAVAYAYQHELISGDQPLLSLAASRSAPRP